MVLVLVLGAGAGLRKLRSLVDCKGVCSRFLTRVSGAADAILCCQDCQVLLIILPAQLELDDADSGTSRRNRLGLNDCTYEQNQEQSSTTSA